MALALDAIFAPNIRFFVARLNGAAVGCGGVAFFADFAEVKRMYVREVARGRGVAQLLLARIEQEAQCRIFAAPAGDGSAADSGAPVLSADWVPHLRGIWRLRHHGTAGDHNQCFPPEATQITRRVMPGYLPTPSPPAAQK